LFGTVRVIVTCEFCQLVLVVALGAPGRLDGTMAAATAPGLTPEMLEAVTVAT
jgi:hypothetical protein